MASAVRSAGALAGRTASASFQRDQPDLDARHVYVSVHADGPTRVLCFSESKDRYTKGAGDESLGQLSKKLERLDARIKARLAVAGIPWSCDTRQIPVTNLLCAIHLARTPRRSHQCTPCSC